MKICKIFLLILLQYKFLHLSIINYFDLYRGIPFFFFRCVVNGKPFYFGVLLPSCIILLSNMLILRLSIVRMRTPKMILKVKERKEFQLVVTRFIICSTILGLTWATGVLAIGYARVVFHWLFCIFNSMQGFAIFICFVVFNKHVRVEIRRSFTTNLKEGCSSACVKE